MLLKLSIVCTDCSQKPRYENKKSRTRARLHNISRGKREIHTKICAYNNPRLVLEIALERVLNVHLQEGFTSVIFTFTDDSCTGNAHSSDSSSHLAFAYARTHTRTNARRPITSIRIREKAKIRGN